MDNNSIVGELLEVGQSVVKKAGDQVKTIAQSTTQQISGSQMVGQAPSADASHNPLGPGIEQNQSQQKPQATQGGVNPLSQMFSGAPQQSPEIEAKLAATRKKLQMELHKENYYDPTFNPPKPREEPVADKLEREKQQEMMELQKKEESKPAPMALNQAQRTTEMNRGASG